MTPFALARPSRFPPPCRRRGVVCAWIVATVLGFSPLAIPAAPDAVSVEADGSGDFPTIQAALAEAAPGAEIRLGSGVFRESLVVRRPVRIVGPAGDARAEIVFDSAPALAVEPEETPDSAPAAAPSTSGNPASAPTPREEISEFENLSFRAEGEHASPAVFARAAARFLGCRFADSAGGLYVRESAVVELRDCEFARNRLSGLEILGGRATVVGCRFHDNGAYGLALLNKARAEFRGCKVLRGKTGALVSDAIAEFEDCVFEASSDAGLRLQMDAEAVLRHVTILAPQLGLAAESDANLRIEWCNIETGSQGALRVEDAAFEANDSEVRCGAHPAAVLDDARGTIRRCRFVSDDVAVSVASSPTPATEAEAEAPAQGKGEPVSDEAFAESPLRFEGSSFVGAQSGVRVRFGMADFDRCIFENSAAGVGLAASDGALVRATASAIRDCAAGGVSVASGAGVRLERCAISSNGGHGVRATGPGSRATLERTVATDNAGPGIRTFPGARAEAVGCDLRANVGGAFSASPDSEIAARDCLE